MFSNHHDRSGRSRLVLAGLLALFSIACASPGPPPPAVVYPDYVVGAPDNLSITVLPAPAIQEGAVVRPDGKITIQLIGDVQAAGRTPGEIAAEIEERVARFKRGARATVAVINANSSSITIFGEVRGPGTQPLPKQTRVAEAIGSAGGPTTRADMNGVYIVRSSGSTSQIIHVDLAAIRNGDLSTNAQLFSGDLIYVPPNLLAEIGYALQAVLFPFQPLLGLANSIAGSAVVP